ncbi:MAG: YaaR family protein [Firmicutes bacterium]|nr:YaaR family protein [Bacillota bacterium]
MRIRTQKDRSLGRELLSGKPTGPSHPHLQETPFLVALRRTINVRDEESLAQAFAAIEEAAATLRRSVTLRNLKRYKELIRAFISELMANAYSTHQETGFDQYGHRRLYVIVQEIDQRLESLTREVVHGQADNLDLVSRLDEIRGLLLDIYS